MAGKLPMLFLCTIMAIISIAAVHSQSETAPRSLPLSNTTTTTTAIPANQQSQPSKTTSYNLTSIDQADEQLLPLLAIDDKLKETPQQPLSPPKSFASSSPPSPSSSLSGSPPFNGEAFAPELGDKYLTPQYPPHPAPPLEALAPAPVNDLDPPPYADVMGPEFAGHNDDFYSPLVSPTPAPVPSPASGIPDYYGIADVAPTPNSYEESPFSYQADDEVPIVVDDEQESGGQTHKGAAVGVVVFAVCLVGLGGFVYKKRKNDHMRRSSQYEYLGKRELEL